MIRNTGQGVRAQHSTEHKRKNKEETGRRTAKTPGEHQLPAGVLNPQRTPGTSPTSKAWPPRAQGDPKQQIDHLPKRPTRTKRPPTTRVKTRKSKRKSSTQHQKKQEEEQHKELLPSSEGRAAERLGEVACTPEGAGVIEDLIRHCGVDRAGEGLQGIGEEGTCSPWNVARGHGRRRNRLCKVRE